LLLDSITFVHILFIFSFFFFTIPPTTQIYTLSHTTLFRSNVNYEPLNHENMVRIRAAKVAAVAEDIPNVLPEGDPTGDLLVVSWGSTAGSITAAVKAARARGSKKIGRASCRERV